MCSDSTFRQMGDSEERRIGQRLILCSGHSAREATAVDELTRLMVSKLSLEAIAVAVATRDDLERPMKDVFASPSPAPQVDSAEPMTRAVIMGGLSEKEIHAFMGGYRTLGLPRPLWATLTPTSQHWPLGRLLTDLSEERRAIAAANDAASSAEGNDEGSRNEQ